MNRITKFKIENFKSIKNSGFIKIASDDIITLIGTNEAGKTNILSALKSLNPNYEFGFDDLPLDSDLKERYNNGEDFPMLTIFIKLENSLNIKEKQIELSESDEIKIVKYFTDNYKFYKNDKLFFERSNDKISSLKTKLKTFLNDAEKDIRDSYPNYNNNQQIKKLISSINEMKGLLKPSWIEENISIDMIYDFSSYSDHFPEEFENDIIELDKLVDEHVELFFDLSYIFPAVNFYSDSDEFILEFNLGDINEKWDYKKLHDIFKLSEIDFFSLKKCNNTEFVRTLDKGSRKITKKLRKMWNDNSIEIIINERNNKIFMTLRDNHLKDPHDLSIRSKGFNQFLHTSMLNNIHNYKNSLLLFDDVGVYLHPKAQKDLLKTFERLTDSNQVIISTHSPFMIDTNKLSNIIPIVKDEKNGTIVNNKIKDTNDIYHPVRLAMGIPLEDSLVMNPPIVLVEGESDKIYLETFFNHLKNELNIPYFSALPCGGVDRVLTVLPMVYSCIKKPVILLDSDDDGIRVKKRITELFSDIQVINYNDLMHMSDGKLVIENLIEFKTLLTAINNIYSKNLDLRSFKKDKRNFREILLHHLDKNEKKHIKIELARYFENIDLRKLDEKTLQNFESLINLVIEKYGLRS